MMMRSRVVSLVVLALLAFATLVTSAVAIPPVATDAGHLRVAIDRLSVFGSALYFAAHPDDENTAFLAWLAQDRLVQTAYLSLTRGDGGQNLIGTELGPALGIIRTEELLAARTVDGAEQYFSRAIDFGYSKSPEETLEIWDRDAILADAVWVIRKHRPDVIVTRFSTTVGGHGHHLASAQLAIAAFEAAGDPSRFPEQLEHVEVWQAKRIMWNNWRPDLEKRSDDLPQLAVVDLGTYNPVLGREYGELSALGRSMHKSQGFGAAARRGRRLDYFDLLAGDPISKGRVDLFDGVDLTAGRARGMTRVGELFIRASQQFDERRPAAVVPTLLDALRELGKVPAGHWRTVKRRELLAVIKHASGIWIEATADRHSVIAGGKLVVTTRVIARSSVPVRLDGVAITHVADDAGEPELLERGLPVERVSELFMPAAAMPSKPYWLISPPKQGTFIVDDQLLRGRPRRPASITARVTLSIGEANRRRVDYELPVVFSWVDPVRGELARPIEVVPALSVALDGEVFLFTSGGARRVTVTVTAHAADRTGEVRLRAPDGWRIEPSSHPVELANEGDQSRVEFLVTPPSESGTGDLVAEIESPSGVHSLNVVRIEHDHIPVRTLFPKARGSLVRVDVGVARARIGYVMGPGDKVPQALRQAGYEVTLLADDAINPAGLGNYDTVVVGIRALNRRASLKNLHRHLLAFVHAGGTLVVQYNTSHRLLLDEFGPYPFKLSRDRVTKEDAPMRFVDPEHRLLRYPNVITQSDFEGWVQERGLYFANEWSNEYQTVLSSNDPGEPESEGSLLFAEYGDGVFIYTGLSFFRQLPAGVPGAYRLFANLVAAGQTERGAR